MKHRYSGCSKDSCFRNFVYGVALKEKTYPYPLQRIDGEEDWEIRQEKKKTYCEKYVNGIKCD